jgi:hypothetical protein
LPLGVQTALLEVLAAAMADLFIGCFAEGLDLDRP